MVSLFLSIELSYLDSNQDKQNQNLLCYHYTIGQSSVPPFGKAVQVLCQRAHVSLLTMLCEYSQNSRCLKRRRKDRGFSLSLQNF